MQTTWRPRPGRAAARPPRARCARRCPRRPRRTRASRCAPSLRDAHQREHHARQLAAGGDVAQRRGRNARVRRDQELGRVQRRSARARARRQRDLERRGLHGQVGQALAHRGGQLRRGLRPRRAQLLAAGAQVGPGDLELGRRPLQRLLGPRQLGVARTAASAWASTAAIDPPCLRARRSMTPRRSSAASSAPGLGVEPFGVAQQLAGDVVGLDRQRPPARRERVERRVHPVDAVQPRAARREQRRHARPVVGRRRPGRRRARRRAARSGGAGARARRAARPPRPPTGRPPRSRPARTAAGPARAPARRPARAAPPARPPARGRARGPRRTPRAPRGASRRRTRRGPPAATRRASGAGARAGRRTTASPRRSRAGRRPRPSARTDRRGCAPRR